MAVLIHVIIALSSVAYTSYLVFKPSASGLKTSYSLVALTLISGTYLVLSTHTAMLQACVSGLLYIGVVTSGLVAVHYKLAKASVTNNDKTD